MIDLIKIKEDLPVPKYRQVMDAISEAIEKKDLKKNQKLPSINEFSQSLNLSRDTVLLAFNELQARGILVSRPGKGYYVAKTSAGEPHKIFLFFDKLTPYKEALYDAFRDELKRQGTVDIFFHNFNEALFESLLRENIGFYTEYVVMPIPVKGIASTLELVPRDKLYILDRGQRIYGQIYPSVCQSFRKDVYMALTSGMDLLRKYRQLNLIFPDHGHPPMDLKRGFMQFCKDHQFPFTVREKVEEDQIKPGEAYLVLDDKNLVKLVQYAQSARFELARDLGVISYNDTPLKAIAANGITTISTDFDAMGRSMVNLILKKKKHHIENPCSLIRRHSL